jgi:tetratricopeptide (TPR) repeat protein
VRPRQAEGARAVGRLASPAAAAALLRSAALLSAAALCCAAARAEGNPPTIKDLDSRNVEIHPEGRVEASPGRAMESYRRFLELQNTDPQLRAEALRRLGDLNLESGEIERMGKEITQLDLQGAEAIKLYTTLLKAYPDYARNDQVLYQLARAYETTGQPAAALATLDEIVRRYPTSAELAEVQFRRGELLFSARSYAAAQGAYAEVVSRGPRSGFYPQSLYKEGWSLFKQGLNEESLPVFAGVLDAVLIDPLRPAEVRKSESLSRPDRELVEDTLRVMSVTFSYLDGATSLDRFVAARGAPPYAHLLYSRLGDLYVDKQRFQDAAATYRAFVSRDPDSEFAPGLAGQAIEAYTRGGFADLVLDGKREYIEHYDFGTPFWQGRTHEQFPKVVADLKMNLRDLAEYFHAMAQKSQSVADYQQAARWYRAFLQSFPNEPESAATNYLLAETLYESHQYAEAAAEYTRTAYGYPAFERSAAAGYAALVAYDKEEPLLEGEARGAWHRQSIEAGLKFAKTFPEHPDSAGVLTRAAQDLYAQGNLPRALETAQAVLAHAPPADPPKQRIAWSIIGECHFSEGAFDQAETAFVAARELVPAGDPQRAELAERIATAVYKQGEAKQKAGDGTGAVEDFLRVARVAPDSKIRATAQYDAGAALINAGQWERAIGVLEGLRRDFPQSEYAVEVRRKLAVAYAQAGHPGEAAAEFERIAADPAEDPAARREALRRAADLYATAGNEARSVAMLERFVADFPTPVAEAEETRQRLADTATRAGDAARASTWLREIVRADATAGAGRTERTHFLAARAELALAAPARDAFRAIRLTVPLKKSIGAKRKALESALADYQRAADYGVAEVTTAATYEMAELYRTLASDLLHSERPPKLSKDELEQYALLLEDQADPFVEQAITLHEANLARTREGVYDAAVAQSLEALQALKPARYAKSEFVQDAIATLDASDAPGSTPPAAPAAADFERAVGLMRAGDATDAELEFKQLASSSPEFAGPEANLGLLYRKAGRAADSEQALREAIRHNESSAMLWTELGLTLRTAGRFQDALEAYAHASQLDDGYAPAHRDAGVLLDLYLGDPVRALAELERYQALTGEDKPVTAWIAELKQRASKLQAAAAKPENPS